METVLVQSERLALAVIGLTGRGSQWSTHRGRRDDSPGRQGLPCLALHGHETGTTIVFGIIVIRCRIKPPLKFYTVVEKCIFTLQAVAENV
jgi:hypothetical protein